MVLWELVWWTNLSCTLSNTYINTFADWTIFSIEQIEYYEASIFLSLDLCFSTVTISSSWGKTLGDISVCVSTSMTNTMFFLLITETRVMPDNTGRERDDLLLSPTHWQTCTQTWITSESNKTGSTQGDKSSWNNKNQVSGKVIPLNVQWSWRDLRAHHWRRSETTFSLLHSHIIPSNFCRLRYCFLCQHTITGGVIEITWRVRGLACLWRSYSRWHSGI